MSKFTVKVELQGYEVKLQGLKFSVEGTKEDAPRIAQQIEKQLSGMIHPPTVMAPAALASGNGHSGPTVIELKFKGMTMSRTRRRELGSLVEGERPPKASTSRTTPRRMVLRNKVGQQCKRLSGSCMSLTSKPTSLR
jgi:hypothetical protein